MHASEARYGGGVTLLLFLFIFLPLLAVLLNVIFPGLYFGQVQSSSLFLVGEIFHRPLWRQSLLAFGGTATNKSFQVTYHPPNNRQPKLSRC